MEEGVALNESEAAIPPLVERAVEGVVLTLICILATGGNVVLWAVVRRTPDLHSSSNYLLLCLSAADLLVAVVNMPLTVYTIFVGRWVLTQGMCVATGFTNMFSFTASVMSLCMITANRYIRVCRPHLYPRLYSPRASLIHIAGVWCLSGLLSLPPLVGWGEYGYEAKHYFCFCTWQQSLSYSVFMVAFCFGGTSSLMGGCYVAIYRTFTRSKRQLAVNTGPATVTHTDNTAIRDRLNSFGDPRAGRDGGSIFGSLRSIRDRLSSFGEQRGGRAEFFGSVSSVRERLGSFGEPRSCSVEKGSFGSLERIGECGSYGEPGPFREKASSFGNMNSFRGRANSDEKKPFGMKANLLADSKRLHSLGSSKNVRYRLDSGGEERHTEEGEQLEPLNTSTSPERVCSSGDSARGSGRGQACDPHHVAQCRSTQHNQVKPAPHGVTPPTHSHNTPGGAAPTLRHAWTRWFSFRTRRKWGGQGCNETSTSMKRLRSKLRSMDTTGSKAKRDPVGTRESRDSQGHGDRARSGEGHGDRARSDKSQETSPEEELLSSDSCTPLTVVPNHVTHYNDCREKTVKKGTENFSRGTTLTEGGPWSASRSTKKNKSENHFLQRTTFTADGSCPALELSEGRTYHNTCDEPQQLQSHSSPPQSRATSPEQKNSIHSTKFSRAAHILRFPFNNLPGQLDVSQPLHATLSGESDVPYPHTDGIVLRSVTKTRCDLDPARTGQTVSETKLGHVASDMGHQDESFTDLRLPLPVVMANHCRGQGQNSVDRLPRSHSAGHCGHRNHDQSEPGTQRSHHRPVHNDISCLSESLSANHSKNQDDISCLSKSLSANHSKSQDDISCLPESLSANHSKSQDDISCLPESLSANHSKSQDDISCLSESPHATQDKSQTSAPRLAEARRDTDGRKRHSDVDGAAGHSVSPATNFSDSSGSSDDVPDQRDGEIQPLLYDDGKIGRCAACSNKRSVMFVTDTSSIPTATHDVSSNSTATHNVSSIPTATHNVSSSSTATYDVSRNSTATHDVSSNSTATHDVSSPCTAPRVSFYLNEPRDTSPSVVLPREDSVTTRVDTSLSPPGIGGFLVTSRDSPPSRGTRVHISLAEPTEPRVSSSLAEPLEPRVSSLLAESTELRVSSSLAESTVSRPVAVSLQRLSTENSGSSSTLVVPNSRDRKDVSASVPCSTSGVTSRPCSTSGVTSRPCSTSGVTSRPCNTCNTLTVSQRSNQTSVPARPPGNTSGVTSRPRSNTYTSSNTNTTCNARTLNIGSASKHASLTVPQVPSVTSNPRVDTTTSPSSGHSNVTPVALAGKTTQGPPRVSNNSFSLKPPPVTAAHRLSSKLSPTPNHCSPGSLQVSRSRNSSSLTRAKKSNPTAAQRVGMTSCPQTLALPDVSSNQTSSATCLTSPTSSALQRVGTSSSLFMAPRVNTNSSLLMPRVNTNASFFMPRVNTNMSFFMPRVNTNTSLASSRDRRRREEMRLTSTMLLVILVYVISWLPYCVMILVNIFTMDGVPQRLDMLALLMGYSNSLYNPLIYGWRNVNIRRGYLKLWKDVRAALLSVSCRHQHRSRPAKVVFEV